MLDLSALERFAGLLTVACAQVGQVMLVMPHRCDLHTNGILEPCLCDGKIPLDTYLFSGNTYPMTWPNPATAPHMSFWLCSMALMGVKNGIVVAGIAALGGLW